MCNAFCRINPGSGHFVGVSGDMRKNLVMYFTVLVKDLAAGSTQIFVFRGDVVAPLALAAPELGRFLSFCHNSSFPVF
jgi:hypothetical protein